MKYTYAYKTSDGVRHEDSMNASSREEVFMELRKRGIKAIKVVAADGSKANGEVRGIRKRSAAIVTSGCANITRQRNKRSTRFILYHSPLELLHLQK